LAVLRPRDLWNHGGEHFDSYACVADVTPPGERAARFGLIGAGFGIGFVLGPALRGLTSIATRRLPRAAFHDTGTGPT